MNNLIYLTKDTIWFDEKSYSLVGTDLKTVLENARKELKISNGRLILGNDILFTASFKLENQEETRSAILQITKGWFPVEIDNDSFDWKRAILASGEVWIQTVGVDSEYWKNVCSSFVQAKINVDVAEPLTTLISESVAQRDTPVIINWSGKEKLKIVCLGGAVDFISVDDADDILVSYVKDKWHLAVNPEIVLMEENEFKLKEKVFARLKNVDASTLSIPVIKKIVGLSEEVQTSPEEKVAVPEEEKKQKGIVFLISVLIIILIGVIYWAYQTLFSVPKEQTTIPEVTPAITETTVSVTPEPVKSDYSVYRIQVLNGSGVSGEAGRIRETLINSGFLNVDVGNATATTETQISYKSDLPSDVSDVVMGSIKDYTVGQISTLTSTSDYDLIIVLGSSND